jgi:hypothetical protein
MGTGTRSEKNGPMQLLTSENTVIHKQVSTNIMLAAYNVLHIPTMISLLAQREEVQSTAILETCNSRTFTLTITPSFNLLVSRLTISGPETLCRCI